MAELKKTPQGKWVLVHSVTRRRLKAGSRGGFKTKKEAQEVLDIIRKRFKKKMAKVRKNKRKTNKKTSIKIYNKRGSKRRATNKKTRASNRKKRNQYAYGTIDAMGRTIYRDAKTGEVVARVKRKKKNPELIILNPGSRKNQQTEGVALEVVGEVPGHLTRMEYEREGKYPGSYFHDFETEPSILALSDGSLLITPENNVMNPKRRKKRLFSFINSSKRKR